MLPSRVVLHKLRRTGELICSFQVLTDKKTLMSVVHAEMLTSAD
jgi:hypothetical protein